MKENKIRLRSHFCSKPDCFKMKNEMGDLYERLDAKIENLKKSAIHFLNAGKYELLIREIS